MALLTKTASLGPDVGRVAVVLQPVWNRRSDDGDAEKLAPLPVALLRREDDVAPFVFHLDQGEEGGGGVPIARPDD